MAEQLGIIPIKGSMDNMTFYKSKHEGMRVKKQSRIPKERIQNDENFDVMRKNNIEFSNAGKAGKLLRNAVNPVLAKVADDRAVSRLMRLMLKAAKADQVNPRGERNVVAGNLHYLEGFNFNKNSALDAVLKVQLDILTNRASGELKISVPSFDPATALVMPKDATHIKVLSAGAELDFPINEYKNAIYESGFITLGTGATNVIDIVHQLPPNSVHPLFLLFGVKFFRKVNGIFEPAGGFEYNTLSIVKVDTV